MPATAKDTGVVNIHGKEYKTVALRIGEFRAEFPNYAVETEVLNASELVQVKATIRNEAGNVIATGLAEEVRGSTNINKTSALENAETSAVGRALAFFGLGGTEIASADEVANAITQQKEYDMVKRLQRHTQAVRDHWESVAAIKGFLAAGDYHAAYEAIVEIRAHDNDGWENLWVSTTDGGLWTTEERKQLKSNEMTAAKNDYHGESA